MLRNGKRGNEDQSALIWAGKVTSSNGSMIMLNTLKRNVLIGSMALIAFPAFAQQPPDSVVSDQTGNTAMGTSALLNLDNANGGNTAAGASALIRNTTGAYNSAFGYLSLFSNVSGIYNTAVGAEALYFNTSGNLNTAVGAGALNANTTGSNNSAFGQNALVENTTGIANTASGFSALFSNTTGAYNTASGYVALYNNTAGQGNTATGTYSLNSNTTGDENTAVGVEALSNNTTGSGNTASGQGALGYNRAGNNNTASGITSLNNATGGSNNTAIGASTLYMDDIGSGNIALGYEAGFQILGSNNIDIGSQGDASDNGFIRIGTKGTHKAAFIEGIYTTSMGPNALPVYVNAAGRLSVGNSSERYKTAILPMGNDTEKLRQLRPVTFHLRTDPNGAAQYGLIAEEVAKVYPELVIRDEAGNIQGVRYDELAPMLLNEMQKQQQKLAEVEQLEQTVAELKQMNQSMQAAMSKLLSGETRVAMR
jgi:trimeric autotransporter adhesin